jgi:TonB family protein
MRHLLIPLLLMASTAHAENWVQTANLDSKGSILSVDMASIDRDSPVRKARFKSVFTADRPIGDAYRGLLPGVRSYRWESALGNFNCAERTLAVSQSILHSADGVMVGNFEVDPGALKFQAVAPQSIGGLLLQAVCASSRSESQPITALAKVKSLVNPDDYYPSTSRRRGEQGSPVVKVCVGPSGKKLREPELTDTSGFPDLDAAAVKVAKAMGFAPAVENGAALPESCIKFMVKFAPLLH